MKEQKIKTYTPSISYNGKKMSFKGMPLEVKIGLSEPFKCKYCEDDISYEHIKEIEPNVNKTLVEDILKYLNKYKKEFKIDTCVRKAHFISQCLVETNKFRKLKEGMGYSPNSIKKYFNQNEFIELTDANILKYKSKFKIIDKRLNIDKTKKDIYKLFPKLNPAYIYGLTKKKKYQEKIDLNSAKTVSIQILSHAHNEKVVANKKYSNRTDIGNLGGDDGFSFLGRGILQLTGRNAYEEFRDYRDKNSFKEETKDFKKIDFTINSNFEKLADKTNVKYAVQSAVWFWDIYKNYAKIEEKADSENIKGVTKGINGKTNHIKERNEYLIKARTDKSFKVYKHYKQIWKKGTEDEKKKIKLIAKKMTKNLKVYDSHHRNSYDMIDKNAKTELKEILEIKPLILNSSPVQMIPLIIEGSTLDNIILKPIISDKNKKR